MNNCIIQDDAFTRSGGDASGQLPRAAGVEYDDIMLRYITIHGPGARQHRAAAPGPHPPAAPSPASHILPDHSCRRWNIQIIMIMAPVLACSFQFLL